MGAIKIQLSIVTLIILFFGMPYNWSFYHPQSHANHSAGQSHTMPKILKLSTKQIFLGRFLNYKNKNLKHKLFYFTI